MFNCHLFYSWPVEEGPARDGSLRRVALLWLHHNAHIPDEAHRVANQRRHILARDGQRVDKHHNRFESKQLLRRELVGRGHFGAKLLAGPLVAKQPHHCLVVQLKMWPSEQGVHILVQRIPLHLREEGEAELVRHLGVLLDLGDAQLFLNGEGVEEVAAEDERVLGGENGVDPAGGDEEGVALFDDNSATLLHLVSEEDVGLPARQCPLFVFLKRTESSIANQNQGGIDKEYYGIRYR